MARPKTIQPDESAPIAEEVKQPAIVNETVMSIAKLLTLTPEQQQLFRANGGTTTEN